MILFGESPTRMVRGNLTIDKLAGYLTTVPGRPMFDRTGLQGIYAIDLSYRPDETGPIGRMNAVDGGAQSAAESDAGVPTASLRERPRVDSAGKLTLLRYQ